MPAERGEVPEWLIEQREDEVDEDRIHRAMSKDGTQIAVRVQGHGPPSVLVHGGLGDGEVSWRTKRLVEVGDTRKRSPTGFRRPS